MLSSIINWLGGLSGPVVYIVVGALVFCENALLVGFVLPGETAVVIGGVLASQQKVSLPWLTVIVVIAAIAGDSVGYQIGHHYGPAILTIRPLDRHRDRIDKARDLIRRKGPPAVFFGRFIALFRAIMPALAGISHLPYRTFLLFNALGGLTWGIGYTLLGYFGGTAYTAVEHLVGRVITALFAVTAITALIVWRLRRRHGHPGSSDNYPGGPSSKTGIRRPGHLHGHRHHAGSGRRGSRRGRAGPAA